MYIRKIDLGPVCEEILQYIHRTTHRFISPIREPVPSNQSDDDSMEVLSIGKISNEKMVEIKEKAKQLKNTTKKKRKTIITPYDPQRYAE